MVTEIYKLLLTFLFMYILPLQGTSYGDEVKYVSHYSVISKIGTYKLKGISYHVELLIGFGGKMDFVVYHDDKSKPTTVIEDATAFSWLDDNTILISASPIYGVPGVYLYIGTNDITMRILHPQCYTRAFPQGADYFKLKEVTERKYVVEYTPYLVISGGKIKWTTTITVLYSRRGDVYYDKNTNAYKNMPFNLIDIEMHTSKKMNEILSEHCNVMPIYKKCGSVKVKKK